ncbi:serine/threonine exchange transporter, LAT family [Clostridium cavendishii DSM 21758]|uniref:Serine/threonine exchange transporter, LAT family n=1 Tax=Clostridium cavendishii DSM 21758 TaxID=1121302 RepID=A0A1M6AFS7_9CLOT|nr:amino acid permease [Clostridium cavendishii]SHI35073.1 serine/threonine exchange transporter, LAT family [Clostridium cavendishii DSM 21758]
MNKTKDEKLEKNLGLFNAITIVIGVVIGSGIFFKPTIVFKNGGSPTLGIGAWIVGGLITMASGLTIAEIAAAIPKTGGIFVYLKELYGERIAFLFGWVQTVIYIPGALAALVIVLTTQITVFIPLTIPEQRIVAIVLLIFMATMNVISSNLAKNIQGIVTIAKLLPIVIIVILGLIKGQTQGLTMETSATVSGFGTAILGTLWAYDGWVNVANMAGEFKRPEKDIPKSIILGILITIIVYVAFNLAIIKILPFEHVINSTTPASDAATILFGNFGSKFIAIGILISIIGAINGYMLTGTRIPYAMAQDNLLPGSKYLAKVNKKSAAPIYCSILEVILAILYIISGSFDMLTNLIMFVAWIFFLMTIIGIFIFRRKFKDIEKGYTVPLYPIIPILGILGALYIIVSTFISNTNYAISGVVITLLGLPIYGYSKRKNR